MVKMHIDDEFVSLVRWRYVLPMGTLSVASLSQVVFWVVLYVMVCSLLGRWIGRLVTTSLDDEREV